MQGIIFHINIQKEKNKYQILVTYFFSKPKKYILAYFLSTKIWILTKEKKCIIKNISLYIIFYAFMF